MTAETVSSPEGAAAAFANALIGDAPLEHKIDKVEPIRSSLDAEPSTLRLRHTAATATAAQETEPVSLSPPLSPPLSPGSQSSSQLGSLPGSQTLITVPDMSSLLFVVPWLQQNAVPVMQKAGPFLDAAWPYIAVVAGAVKLVCESIPMELVPAIMGLIMIFFGGHYLTTIAAAEAFRMVGWRTIRDSLRVLRLNYRKARLGLRQDRLQRLKKGEVSPEQEFTEKVRIVLRSVDPERLSSALSSLWAGILAAIATVRYRYAQTITLGASLGEVFEEYAGPYVRPVIAALVPPEYQQWCPVILSYGAKWIGVCIAWALQRVISALQSSMRGAQMMTDSVRQYLINHKYISPDTSPLGFQALSMAIAFFGVSWQLSTNFVLPFPLNIICLPFAIIEWFLTTVVNFAPAAIPGAMPAPSV